MANTIRGSKILTNSIAAGAQLADAQATTPTSIILAANRKLLPPGFFYVGKVLRITGACEVSNVVTTPGTLTLDIRLNATPIVVMNGGAAQLSTTAHTTLPLLFQALVTCQVVGTGTSAKLMGQGTMQGIMVITSAADITTHGLRLSPSAAPAQGTGFDSTVANVLDLFATFSVTTSGTNIKCHQYVVEELN